MNAYVKIMNIYMCKATWIKKNYTWSNINKSLNINNEVQK